MTLPDFVHTIARSIARRCDRIAVEARDARISYADLDRLSNALAHRLRSVGVEPGARVGISLRRGAAELVAMLAVAKLGAAYVPLSPSHPLERLRFILDDADPFAIVLDSCSPLREGLPETILVLEDLDRATADQPSTPVDAPLDPDAIAYLMYTSGSTGRPKGVEIGRAALTSFLASMAHTPGLGQDERLLAITTTSFDIAGLELWLPLCVGATVVIADLDTARDPRLLRCLLETSSISTMQATPATWRLLLEAGWAPRASLRMLCGGEAMSGALARGLLCGGGELWNMYGPTETTIWSSIERIEPSFDRITIGRPIDHTQIRILDEAQRPLAVGEQGEIGIGGRGLARGYRNRPDLTRERFVPDPLAAAGDRIYLTGDLGRELADGRIEWLGRIDHQVKIRGHRIELGEVEAVLRSAPGVAEAVVTAARRDAEDARLVAYWTGDATRQSLVDAARRQLPPYMVPSAYVQLESLPLDPNGKIDRKRLPSPDMLPSEDDPARRPRTDTQTRIAAVWRDMLGLANVPVDQDFFTLGGTSVLALSLVARIEAELGVDIPLQVFFEQPTIEALAQRIGEEFSRDAPIIVRLRSGAATRAPLFCLFGLNLYQDLAVALTGDRPVIGTHVPFRYVPGRDRRPSLAEIGRRYVEVVRSHQAQGPYHLLGLCFGGIVAYEVARQLEALGERVDTVVVIDAVLPTAIHVDIGKRLRGYLGAMQRAWRDPRAFERWLRERPRRVVGRIPLLRRLEPPPHRLGELRPIDLPIDGPEVDAEIRRFAGAPGRLAGRLLVVRATAEPTPAWMHVDADLGWAHRAEHVIVHAIAADHLGVLQEPHVQSLARAVVDASGSRPG